LPLCLPSNKPPWRDEGSSVTRQNTTIEMLISLLLQASLGVLGLIVSLLPEFTAKYRVIIIAAFSTISVIVVALTVIQDKENQKQLDNLTGGDSFPVVVPQTHAGVPIPLVIWNRGKSILSGVVITIRNTQDFSSFPVNRIEIGTIPPGGFGFQAIPAAISPSLNDQSMVEHGEKIDSYWIQMSAQNGTFVEILQFRKGKNCLPWAYRYWVDKPVMISETAKKTEATNKRMEGRLEWSDDLGDGK